MIFENAVNIYRTLLGLPEGKPLPATIEPLHKRVKLMCDRVAGGTKLDTQTLAVIAAMAERQAGEPDDKPEAGPVKDPDPAPDADPAATVDAPDKHDLSQYEAGQDVKVSWYGKTVDGKVVAVPHEGTELRVNINGTDRDVTLDKIER